MKKMKLCQDISGSCPDYVVDHTTDSNAIAESKSEVEGRTQRDIRVSNQDDGRQKDPMKIKLILERVFDFCDVETLKNIRLVSTEWLNDSLKAWRDKAVLQICVLEEDEDEYESLKFEGYLQLLESHESDDVEEAKLRNLKKYPFKRFQFFVGEDLVDEFPNELVRQIADITRYLNLFCCRAYDCQIHELKEFLSNFRSLEHIRIGLCFDKDYEYNSNEEDFLDFELPKIKRLQIEIGEYSSEEVQVLKWFPNLDALSLWYDKDGDMKKSACIVHLSSFLKIVRRLRQSGGESILSLKELEMNSLPGVADRGGTGWGRSEIIQDIIACRFPLEKLTFTVSVSAERIDQLLESCKDTLQYLKISFQFGEYDIDMYGRDSKRKICMGKLKEVSLGNGHHRALSLLTHLKLPKLEKLTIEKDENGDERIKWNYTLLFPKGIVYKALEALEFLDDHTMPSPGTIETFAKIMPNLVHLTIPLDKTAFQIVCEKFRGLKTLNVLSLRGSNSHYEELDDESMTGISNKAGVGSSRPRRPNITDLTLLRDLKICCDSPLRRNDVKFTGLSVTLGFLLLPRLFSLSIAFKDISEDVKEKLLNHLKGDLHIQVKKPSADDDHCNIEIGNECETYSDEGEEK